MSTGPAATTVEQYIRSLPSETRQIIERVRRVICQAVPGGEERISYGMPAVFQEGVVVYYAAFKKHIGLYPPVRDPAVKATAARYAGPKGNLQFPLSEPLPLELIEAVARSRLADNLAKRTKGSASSSSSQKGRPNADA